VRVGTTHLIVGIAVVSLLGGACGQDRVASPPVPQFTSGQRAEPTRLGHSDVGASGGDEQIVFDLQAVEPDVSGTVAENGADGKVSVGELVLVDDTGRAAPNEMGWQRFDEELSRRLVPANLAAGVAVMVDGELVHEAAFGVRLPGTVDATTTTDRFRIASISKTVTAVVVMQLVDEGVLELDEPIGQVLIDALGVATPDPDAGRLTIRQLLSHRSGFPAAEGIFFGDGATSCADAAVRGLTSMVGSGIGYDYSNMNYCLLGLLIEAQTGKTYERVVQESLLDPLGIGGMRFTSTYEIGPDEVSHFPGPGRNFMEVLGAAGSWNATPTDIVRIVNSVDPATGGWKSLSPESMAALRGLGVGYGLGVINYDAAAWGHTGTIQNTHAMVLVQADGITWALTVAGDYPSETSQLRNIFQASLVAAFPG
jgi:D-alanyl-D-alanine carboxypeptidase